MTDIVLDPLRWEALEAGDSAVAAAWLASEGDHVAAGQPLLEVELVGERIAVTAPPPGVLEQILMPAGERFGPGAVLARVVAF